jgi:hypothetical protein
MKLLNTLKIAGLSFLLSGCLAYTGGGVYRDTTDPVTGTRTVQSFGIAFMTVNQGIFSGSDSGVGLGGKVINGTPYFVLGYSGNEWLFMERATFRFADSPTTYTVKMSDPERYVTSGASVHENQNIRADRGEAGALLNEIIRRSKLPQESKLYVRAEGNKRYVSALGTVSSGQDSFGAFFEEYSE